MAIKRYKNISEIVQSVYIKGERVDVVPGSTVLADMKHLGNARDAFIEVVAEKPKAGK